MEIRSFIRDFFSVVFPRNCIVCSDILLRGEEFLCLLCINKLPVSKHEDTAFIKQKFAGGSKVSHACAFLKYIKGNATQKILYRIKYGDGKDLANQLGRLYGKKLINSPIHLEADFIIPVPLHKNKLKRRGFNQSEYFASGLAELMDKDVRSDLLVRVQNNSTQTRKSRIERWLNVESIFEVTKEHEILGKHILLVDDVITTGATLGSCVEILFKAGASEVSVVSLAYAG